MLNLRDGTKTTKEKLSKFLPRLMRKFWYKTLAKEEVRQKIITPEWTRRRFNEEFNIQMEVNAPGTTETVFSLSYFGGLHLWRVVPELPLHVAARIKASGINWLLSGTWTGLFSEVFSVRALFSSVLVMNKVVQQRMLLLSLISICE